jgi:hypothetical protein
MYFLYIFLFYDEIRSRFYLFQSKLIGAGYRRRVSGGFFFPIENKTWAVQICGTLLAIAVVLLLLEETRRLSTAGLRLWLFPPLSRLSAAQSLYYFLLQLSKNEFGIGGAEDVVLHVRDELLRQPLQAKGAQNTGEPARDESKSVEVLAVRVDAVVEVLVSGLFQVIAIWKWVKKVVRKMKEMETQVSGWFDSSKT